MGNQVYANGMEIACKAASGKSICAFPDVCFTPPQTPATPPGVPIPYPNTGMASDTSDGSKTVQISGQEVMLKDKSYFKKSTGDEAGSAPKKSVITSKIQGKVYFNAWSMNVRIEGENVVRHFDLTTHNHASQTGATPPFPYSDAMVPPSVIDGVVILKCKDEWDSCQKKQMCTKAHTLNKTAPLKKQAITPAIKAAKKKYQADYRTSNPIPGGQWSNDCAKTNGKPVDADHVIDVQWGGNVKGPFEYLDMSVNRSIGKQMDLSKVNPAKGFKTDANCGC
jgi:hypothetical protein